MDCRIRIIEDMVLDTREDRNINMETTKYFNLGKLNLSIGWFIGEPFKLFSLTILEFLGFDGVVLFDFQIAKFCFCIYWS
jgi:hypothetical protein